MHLSPEESTVKLSLSTPPEDSSERVDSKGQHILTPSSVENCKTEAVCSEVSSEAHGSGTCADRPAGDDLSTDRPAAERFAACSDPQIASSSSPEQQRRPYDCNICFENANNPVVTRCGHLYCWPCLHAWLKRGVLECPVCKSGVTKETVIPIYGVDNVDPRTVEPDIPERPRGEFTEPPQHEGGVTWSSLGATLTGSSLTLGVFPYGVTFSFRPLNWFNADGPQTRRIPPTREEQLSQFLSMLFLFLGIFVTVWLLIVGGGSSSADEF